MDKLKNLRENALTKKWYIPVKADEALGVCLTAAIKLAQEGKHCSIENFISDFFFRQGNLEKHNECKEFIDIIVPEAFEKVDINRWDYSAIILAFFLVTNNSISLFMATRNSMWNIRYGGIIN